VKRSLTCVPAREDRSDARLSAPRRETVLRGGAQVLRGRHRGGPEHWPVIPGTGGLRKARVSRAGMGKRGGARTIYLHWAGKTLVLLLHVYAKNVQEDIDATQKKLLGQLRDQFMESYRD